MGTLNKRFQYTWFGDCDPADGGSPCFDYLFSQISSSDLSKIKTISTIDDQTSEVAVFDPSTPNTDQLDRFECGKMYIVTLNPSAVGAFGSSALSIDNLVSSSAMSKTNKYGISVSCNYNATPTPTSCTPTGFLAGVGTWPNTTQDYTGNISVTISQPGAEFGFDPTHWTEGGGLHRTLRVYDNTGAQVVKVTTPTWPNFITNLGTEVYYSDNTGGCYEGTMEIDTDNNFKVDNLIKLFDYGQPDPDPVTTPTKTPGAPTTSCISSSMSTLTRDGIGAVNGKLGVLDVTIVHFGTIGISPSEFVDDGSIDRAYKAFTPNGTLAVTISAGASFASGVTPVIRWNDLIDSKCYEGSPVWDASANTFMINMTEVN